MSRFQPNAVVTGLRDAGGLTTARVKAYLWLLGGMSLAAVLGWIGLSRHGLDLLGKPLGADFPSFWAASRLALEGAPAKVYDLAAHAKAERSAFGGARIPYSAFFYPPTYLLICLPLGLAPYLGALAAWLGATGYACWRVVRAMLGARARRWVLPMLAFPGVLSTLGHGQNAFLTTALFGAAILSWDRRPLLAGICFGLLTAKPQLGLMIPLALIVSGRWRVFASACATALGLAALALATFGTAAWRSWLGVSPLARRALEEDWVGSEKMQSAFAAVRLLHGGLSLAYGVQAAVALAAGAILVRVIRGRSRLFGVAGEAGTLGAIGCTWFGVPPCSNASIGASLFALDPPSARRRTDKRRDAGRPVDKFDGLRRVEHRAMAKRRDLLLSAFPISPVFGPSGGAELDGGTPSVPTPSSRPSRAGRVKSLSEASLDASEHGGTPQMSKRVAAHAKLQSSDPLAQGAALATASLLASPFMLDYDLMLLALPLAWLVREQAKGGALPWERCVMTAAFLLPLISRLVAGRLGVPLGPPVVFALLLVVARRASSPSPAKNLTSRLDMAIVLP